jgi:hypothetical protein
MGNDKCKYRLSGIIIDQVNTVQACEAHQRSECDPWGGPLRIRSGLNSFVRKGVFTRRSVLRIPVMIIPEKKIIDFPEAA